MANNSKIAPTPLADEMTALDEEELDEQELSAQLRTLLKSYEQLNQQYDQRIDTILVKKRNN